MTLTLEQLRERRSDITRLASQNGARHVRILGSVARREAGPDSDVDVLVAFDRGRSLLDLIAVQQDLTELLGCHMDVVSEGALKPGDRILREAVALLGPKWECSVPSSPPLRKIPLRTSRTHPERSYP
ncbi:MAG: nucleotidyltransferase family protein [Planctomycetes bacterium]|nr:nucleotidyltransferase family protein [Planctomycetota bacterium]